MKKNFTGRGCFTSSGGGSGGRGGGGGGGGVSVVNGSNSAMATTSCCIPECTRPRFEREGIVHDFCGRTHASEALSRGLIDNLRPPHGVCHRCQLRGCNKDVYFDHETGRVHDFCSRRHADMAMARREWPLEDSKGRKECKLSGCRELVYRDPVSGEESDYCSNRHVVAGRAQQSRQCVRPGCERTAWIDVNSGDPFDYCGIRCARATGKGDLAGSSQCSLPGCVEATLIDQVNGQDLGFCCEEHRFRATRRDLAPITEPFVDRTFRGGTTSATDFRLSVLTNRHADHQSVKEQFKKKWIKAEPASGVSVLRIFKVEVPADIRKKTKRYQEIVTNVRRRFHGTSCSDACNFFVDLQGGPCGEQMCAVCNICTHGFKVSCAGRTAQRAKFDLRFGEGLYFSSVSGKANDYAELSEKTDKKGRQVRCMFVASVAVGNAFVTHEGKLPVERCPPQGYDSVIGEVGPNLNYDEVVVYKEEAALPTHLIVYAFNP